MAGKVLETEINVGYPPRKVGLRVRRDGAGRIVGRLDDDSLVPSVSIGLRELKALQIIHEGKVLDRQVADELEITPGTAKGLIKGAVNAISADYGPLFDSQPSPRVCAARLVARRGLFSPEVEAQIDRCVQSF